MGHPHMEVPKKVRDSYDIHNRQCAIRPGRFDGKVVLITGGTSGLGADAAVHITAEGGKVVITGRREEKGNEVVSIIKKAGGEASFVQASVGNEDDCKRIVDECVEKYGKLDGAFNNAGVAGEMASIHECSLEEWQRVMQTNVDGVFLSMKYEIQAMLKNAGGSIVNCSSIYGLSGASFGAHYSTSKHAVVGLTKSAAHAYGM